MFGRLADFLRPARQAGWVVVRRLRKDVALFSLPPPKPPSPRPSHADKRKALQREALLAEIEEALAGRPTKERVRELADRLLELAI